MSKTKEAKSAPRRDFLRTAGLGAIVGATAAAITGSREAEAAVSEEAGKSGYRESAHVRKAYELSRF